MLLDIWPYRRHRKAKCQKQENALSLAQMSINKNVFQAGIVMLGTIIGAGALAIPSVFHTYGLVWGSVLYWGIAAMVACTHMLMMDVVFAHGGKKKIRFPGHVTMEFGKVWGALAFLSHPAQSMGACLAYIILGGDFLYALGGGHLVPSVLFWQGLFWAGGAVTVILGMKFLARVETRLTWLLVGALIVTSFLFARQADPALFFSLKATWVWAPLGILVFSQFGLSIIPEIIDLSGNQREGALLAIVGGSLMAALLMWIFGVMTYAAAPALSDSATSYSTALPQAWWWIIPCVGFLAVATSFLTLMEGLKHTLMYDAKLGKNTATAVSLTSPLFLLLLTSRDFLGTVSFVGGVFSATNGALATAMGAHVRRQFWPYLITLVFLLIIFSRILSLI